MSEMNNQFEKHAGKLVNTEELVTAIENVINEENGKIKGYLRKAFLKPAEKVQRMAQIILEDAVTSGHPDAAKWAYTQMNGDPVKKTYLDGKIICGLVASAPFKEEDKQTIYKAIEKSPDHAEKAKQGKIKSFTAL